MTQDIKELLELAAKACGYSVSFDQYFNTFYWDRQEVSDEFVEWRPDLDDGDGARMEAELGLVLVWKKGYVACWHRFYEGDQLMELVRDETYADHNGNRQAARRMASLHVAAELRRRTK